MNTSKMQALQCPVCNIVAPASEEDTELLKAGARALITCPVCGAQFPGEPDRVWIFGREYEAEG